MPERHDKHAFSMRSTLELVLREATHHRLHPAMMLVAKERLNPHQVLALQWRFVDLQHARIGYPVYTSISDRINESLRWHKSRLRLETLNADQVWDERSFVIAKPDGSKYSMSEADTAVAELFGKFGIESIGTLSSLRHPVFAQHTSPSSPSPTLGRAFVMSGRKTPMSTDDLITLDLVLTDWIDRRVSLRDSTRLSYRGHIRNHLIPVLGSTPLHMLTTRVIEDAYRVLMADANLSPATLERVHATLHACLEWAVTHGLLDRNPASRVELPRTAAVKPEGWAVEQARTFLAFVQDDPLEAL